MYEFRFSYLVLRNAVVSFILALTLIFTTKAQCDECIDNRIILFDAAVNVPPPPDSATQEAFDWLSLFQMSRNVRYFSHWEDPSKECFIWIDGGMYLANSAQGGTFKFGSTYSNTAPSGPIKATPYLMTGSITSTGKNREYTITWQIECGTTREVVRSSTANFSANLSRQQLHQVAKQVAAGLQPVHQTIQDFEIKKRDEDMGVARSTSGFIKVTPEKKNLQPNDSTKVELEFMDICDDYVLKNREIILEPYTDPETGEKLCNGPTGGTVRPKRITTDENGKATVTFIAGKSGGLGIIDAVYRYKKPHGWIDAMFGEASINLAKSMWDVKVEFQHSANSTTNMTSMEGESTTQSTGDSYFYVNANMSFVFENKNSENAGEDRLIISAPDDESSGIAHGFKFMGNYQEAGMSRIEKKDGEGNTIGLYNSQSNISGQGIISMLNAGLNFEYSKDGVCMFSLSGTVHRQGISHTKISSLPDGGPEKIDDEFSVANVMFTSFEPEAKFKYDGSGYTVDYFKRKTTNEQGASSTYTIKVHAQFTKK